jgi:hypothetical protein
VAAERATAAMAGWLGPVRASELTGRARYWRGYRAGDPPSDRCPDFLGISKAFQWKKL